MERHVAKQEVFVFVHPSFIRGMASIANPYKGLTSYTSTKGNADVQAIASDWHSVGQDFRYAIKVYEKSSVAA